VNAALVQGLKYFLYPRGQVTRSYEDELKRFSHD